MRGLALWSISAIVMSVTGPLHATHTSCILKQKTWLSRGVSYFVHDVTDMCWALVSEKTAQVLIQAVPFFIGGLAIDDTIHRQFYCKAHHRNRHCPPRSIHMTARVGTALTIIACALPTFFAHDPVLQKTAEVFTCGLTITYALKALLKKIHWEPAIRPKNGNFRKKDYYGGWPSGHMIHLSYATTLFSKAIGPTWGVPLGILSTFIGTEFLAANRHTLSQIVAGTALGVVCGFAAYTVVTRTVLSKNVECGMLIDQQGYPCCNLSFSY